MATVTGATEHLEQLVRDMEDAGPGATESRAYRAIVAELKRRANEDAPDAVPGVEGEEIRASIQEGTDPMTEDSPTNDLPFPMARPDVAKWATRCDRGFDFSDAQLDSLAAYANRYPDPAERLSALWDGANTFDTSNRIPDDWDEEVEPGLYGRTRDLAHYPSLPPGGGRHSFNLAVTQFERSDCSIERHIALEASGVIFDAAQALAAAEQLRQAAVVLAAAESGGAR